MRHLSLLLMLSLGLAVPLCAQGMKAKDKDRKAREAERRKKQKEMGMRSLPTLPKLGDEKLEVAKATAKATELAGRLKLKGRTKRDFIKGWTDVARENHTMLEAAHKRYTVVVASMAKEVSALTGVSVGKFKVRETQLIFNLYACAIMRPNQLRQVQQNAERQNPYSVLIKEVKKDADEVKKSIEAIRNLLASDDPFKVGSRMYAKRRDFEGSLKTMFKPEEYFEYLKLQGKDKAPENALDMNSRIVARALRQIDLTPDQRRKVFRIVRNTEMDADLKYEKVMDLLNDKQKKKLRELVKKGQEGRDRG